MQNTGYDPVLFQHNKLSTEEQKAYIYIYI